MCYFIYNLGVCLNHKWLLRETNLNCDLVTLTMVLHFRPKSGGGGQGRTCQDTESNNLRFTDGATVYPWANDT